MRRRPTRRHRIPLLLVGLLVLVAVGQLWIGVPWSIWCERDLQLHGRRVQATATAERWITTKRDGPVRQLRMEYTVDGTAYHRWLALGALRVGDTELLHYPPVSPRRAVRRPAGGWSLSWDHGLVSRLLTCCLLGLVFAGVWLALWRDSGRRAPGS